MPPKSVQRELGELTTTMKGVNARLSKIEKKLENLVMWRIKWGAYSTITGSIITFAIMIGVKVI